MEKNVGSTDRNIRLGAGAVLLLVGVIKSWWLLAIIGIVLLATGFMNFCPAYKLIGMKTNR